MKIKLSLILIALVDASRVVPYTSDIFGVLLAMLGGLFVMGRRAETKELTLWQAICEVGLSGGSGYVAHAIALGVSENPRMVWVSCFLAGCAGSKGIEAWIKARKRKLG